jgi:RimJ/RimL family protein N-acetyltransferase
VPNALRDLADLDGFLERVASAHRAGSGFFYGIEDGGEVIGQCSLHDHGSGQGEVGYWVRTDRTGGGVATRAVRALVAAACDAGFRELVIHCDAGNVRSVSVARNAGLTYVRTVEIDRGLVRTSARTGWEMSWIFQRPDDVCHGGSGHGGVAALT